ncbi:acyl-CoA dehydrogenase family protein [Micromonospora sp. NPDC047074]|uniref:acyl-CoA dehydrogenase family protein n=1 Tax=Micromonospora sp. NPDC047074 TaxID=3154339 RepID=UPI00340A867E
MLNDDVPGRDRTGELCRTAWQRCAEFGVQGLPFPKAVGGQEASLLDTVVVLEALGYGCRDNGLLFSLNAHLWSCALPILKFGDDTQRARYLPALCDGSRIGVQAVTESGSGSDALSVATTARPDGDDFILDGAKTFITNAPVADVFVVLAALPGESRLGGLCAFVVERDTPGLSVSRPVAKLGLHTSPMGEVYLDGCRVPGTALLGGRGSGMTVFNTTIEWERSFVLATALGTMQRQLDESVGHARTHRRFGQPIGRNQAVSSRIVDMRVRLEAARLLLYQLAWLKDQGRRTTMESSIVKLFVSEALVASSLAAFDTHGAAGYMAGTEQERDLRDALASRIYSGTSDIQRNIIAGMMGL